MLDWLDKLSFADILHFVKENIMYVFKKWYVVLLFIVIGAVYGYWKVYDIKPSYSASITFVLSTETKAAGGLGGIAAQFGLDAGTGGSESVFSGDNIFELFKTRKIAERSLLQEVVGTNQVFYNYIHSVVNHKQINRTIKVGMGVGDLNPQQLSAIRAYTDMISKSVTVFKKDKKLSYYTITASGTHEGFVYNAAKLVLNEASNFFIETRTKVARKNLDLLTKEADSLYALLSGTISKVASVADETYNLNPSMVVKRAPAQLNGAKLTALSGAYTEVMRQLELAKINIQKETPLYQVIDEPIRPLDVSKPDLIIELILHAIYGLIIALLLLVGLKYRHYVTAGLRD